LKNPLPTPARLDLSSLLGATAWDEFRRAFARREAIVREGTDAPHRLQPLWADWELEAACRFTPVPHDERFRLLLRRKQIPVKTFTDRMGVFREDAFRQLRAAGASVAFAGYENYSNSALALSRALEVEFQLPVQVNVYLTPAGRQGLGVHVDPHDVLVLQIQGTKDWDIYDAAAAGAAAAPRRVRLGWGGWLFLPKGTRHEVCNRGEVESVHFTVGFHPLTWGEVLQRALLRARVATPGLNLPLPAHERVDADPEAMVRRLRAILPFVDLPGFLASYYADFPALAVPVPADALVPREVLEQAGPATGWCWNGALTLAVDAAALPQVTAPYRRFPLVLKHELGGVLTWMKSAPAFSAADVPLPDKADGLLLCRFLAGVGVLRIVPNGATSTGDGGDQAGSG
jgi:hypothetical protein